MFTFIRSLRFNQLFIEQVPIFIVSLIIAELFYKFHSFTLECTAFLATWFVIDAFVQWVLKGIQSRRLDRT